MTDSIKYKVKKQRPLWPSKWSIIEALNVENIEWKVSIFSSEWWFDGNGCLWTVTKEHYNMIVSWYLEPVRERPNSWEELWNISVWYWTDIHSWIRSSHNTDTSKTNKILWPTKEMAEAQLALSQLIYLRDAWRDWWEPKEPLDWYTWAFFVPITGDECCIDLIWLSFEDKETLSNFEETFKDLITKIKPLYFS